ncbi:LysM peptidoglycan-binding domain-containing protein [Paenibacillus physcomitrellae]|uniref:LysM peptidoglycan-binding domain-containing protein n=1 Tax=Paenibacillus physcomitrellae TaxID=1619311 RepID=UPI0012FDE6E0|nr:LysM peptidoglycan-binding domain-containing protein [Paenibacillus physcomitrellae]
MKHSTYKSIYPAASSVLSGSRAGLSHTAPTARKVRKPIARKSLIRSLIVVAVLILSLTGFISAFAASVSPGDEPVYDTVIVMPGDTLWNIALANKPSGMDTRKYVHMLTSLNHLHDSSIQAGDILNLPITD